MDEVAEVKRGGSRFSTTKRHFNKQLSASSLGRNLIPRFDAIRGDHQFSEKSKKEKVRSLSAVAKALSTSYEMGCNVSGSHKPNASTIIATKKFKLPRKFFNDCNRVDHASVPRKIRSAMKKRGRESILPDSEKVNHKIDGIESLEKDGIKKSKKQGSPDGSTRQVVHGPITKDEEEVAETLYALAGMFPNNGSNGKSEPDCESLPDKSSVLQDQLESTNAPFEALGIAQDASLRGASKISSLNETAKFLVSTHSTAPKINMMVRSENDGKIASHESELCLQMGLNVPTQSQVSHTGRQHDVEFETAGGIDCKQEQHITEYQTENGLALWPGLSSRASAGINASDLQSSAAAKVPDWLNAAISASKQDLMESCSSDAKISKVVIHKKSWKKCAIHVHISHLIRSLEVPKGQVAKEPELYECHQIMVHQGSKRGVLMETPNLTGMRNGNSSASGAVHSATVSNSNEIKNGILQQPCHYHDDVSQTPPTPEVYGPQKQSFNFLSLSTGSNGLKVNDCFNKGGSRLDPSSKSQVPYFQSLQQQHGLMPIPMPQSQYASTSYLDQLPAAGPQLRLQQPHYYGTPLCGTHYSSKVSYKQQQQNFWAVQLAAAQGGPTVNCNFVRAQYPNWQNGRVDSSAATQFAQVILPHSPVSLEALSSKITSTSEPQPFTLASSLTLSRTNGLEIHLPSVYEESRGRFRGNGTPSLQLLCDERIGN